MLNLDRNLLLGLISLKDATFIQRNVKIILDVQLKRASGESPVHDEAALAAICRRDPAALNELAPFLGDAWVQSLMQSFRDGRGDG